MGLYKKLLDGWGVHERGCASLIHSWLTANFNPQSVIDIGCGNGVFLLDFMDAGVEVRGVDYETVAKKYIGDNFVQFNLKQRLQLDKKYDLALSIEVIEHIEHEYEDIVISNISHSANIILFSGAKPNQVGTNHVNCQTKEYWLSKFAKEGFELWADKQTELIAFMESEPEFTKCPWLVENLVILKRSDNIINLAKADGNYQDVVIEEQTIVDGWRGCNDRWDIIKPYIKNHQNGLDIGSHFGYFANKITSTYPDNIVWSFEASENRAEVQRLMLRLNDNDRVLLSQHAITLNDLVKIVRTCETADFILCLSTIHYFKLNEIPQILWLMGQIAPNLIIEFPSPLEADVAEKDTVNALDNPMYLLGMAFNSVIKIGEAPSPKDPTIKRSIYLAQNYNITRRNCVSYLGAKTGRGHTVQFKDARWTIDNNIVGHLGFNLANLAEFNLINSIPNELLANGAKKYMALIKKTKGKITDIHPRNLIVTAKGVVPIDFSEGVNNDIYGLTWEEYNTKVKQLTELQLLKGLRDKYFNKETRAVLNYK